MERPCAYCKEFGHHIRACKLLEAKNRRQQSAVTPTFKQVLPSVIKVSISAKPSTKNTFAELYSSDDEVEEGEIVEEHRPKRMAVVSVLEPSCEPPTPPPPQKWTRSGVKGVHVPRCLPVERDSDNEGTECDYEAIKMGMASIAAYVAQFRGMSWVDIGLDSNLV